MKRVFLLLCVITQACLGQSLSPKQSAALAYAVTSISGASKIAILFETKKGSRPAVFTEFADIEWQRKFAELLRQSKLTSGNIHVFGFSPPTLAIVESKVAMDFPNRGILQIEVSEDGKPLNQTSFVIEGHQWDLLLEMIMKKRANQPTQRNAGSRPSSGDSPASETPSSRGPRG